MGIFFMVLWPLGLRNKKLKYMKTTKTAKKRRFLNGTRFIRGGSVFPPLTF